MSLAVTREIQTIIDMDLTAFGVNLSKVLVSQRESIAELMQIRDKLKAEVAEVTAQRDSLARLLGALTGGVEEDDPKISVSTAASPTPEQPAEEDGDSEVNVEIKVTGNGPIPPELAAMLNDLTSILQSAARKK